MQTLSRRVMSSSQSGALLDMKQLEGRAIVARGLALAGLVVLVSACSTTTRQPNEVGLYPSWLIAVAEPAAPAIGMAISAVQWRHGRLQSSAGALAEVRTRMRPLDVLLFSNKHRLSGHTGAGMFGHSAVYLGSERELKAMGLWNNPAIVPYHDAIREGRSIIESAQAHGAQLSPVDHLVDTDRLVVLRPHLGSERRKHEAIVKLFGLVGTPFDHHYRLDEQEHVYCTEIISLGITGLNLPRRSSYGREIILPDDIARSAVTGTGRLRLVAYLRADRHSWGFASANDLAKDIAATQPR